MFGIKFWGTRGSIARPGKDYVIYGGNTSCIEIIAAPNNTNNANDSNGSGVNRKLIIDAGTGVKDFGDALIAKTPRNTALTFDLFMTHTHIDHISGLMLCRPFFRRSATLNIFGPKTVTGKSLYSAFDDFNSEQYWPVGIDRILAKITELGETEIALDSGVKVKTRYLNHPVLCLAYRFEYEGCAIVTAYDTEPYRNYFASGSQGFINDYLAAEGERAALDAREKLCEFARGADLLVYDGQYTEDEYNDGKVDWGHSYISRAIEDAGRSQVKRLVVTHHDPDRSDDELIKIEASVPLSPAFDITFAKDGLEIKVN
jgi:phosphoribosyl 1,2-cyclic phosphodiesterase